MMAKKNKSHNVELREPQSTPSEKATQVCPDCNGLGYREHNGGLIRVTCRACRGKGKC